MKFIKSIAAAAVLAAAATGANAAIDNGAGGNGELFFNIWDANGSYTRSLEVSIDSFQSQIATAGNLNLSWTADSTFTSFLAGANASQLKWNIVAVDTSGARRLLETFTAPKPGTTKANDVIRSAALDTQSFASAVNSVLGGADSVAVNSASAAWAGKASFGDTLNSKLNFSNAGTLTNNTYASGLGFMRIDAAATGIAASTYTPYADNSLNVNAWLDSGNTLHLGAVAAVPEPTESGMLLAGLGMLGFMARRRNKRA